MTDRTSAASGAVHDTACGCPRCRYQRRRAGLPEPEVYAAPKRPRRPGRLGPSAETQVEPVGVQDTSAPTRSMSGTPTSSSSVPVAADPVAVASSASVSPAPEPEAPHPMYPLADLLTWYGSAPARAKAGTASPDERQAGCGELYVLHGKVYAAWPVRQPQGWVWYLALDGTRLIPNNDAFPYRKGVTLAESEYAAAHPSRTDSWGRDSSGRDVLTRRNGHGSDADHRDPTRFPHYTGEKPWDPNDDAGRTGLPEDPDEGMWYGRRS